MPEKEKLGKKAKEELYQTVMGLSEEDKKDLFDALVPEVILKNLKEKGSKIVKKGLYIAERVTFNARDGHNPKTGEKIKIAAKDGFKFKITIKPDKFENKQ